MANTRQAGRLAFAGDSVKTLSVRQPWAELIVRSIKPVENRDWHFIPRQKPQWLAIHASQKEEPGCAVTLREDFSIEAYALGAIVGAAYWSGSYDWKTLPKSLKGSEYCNPNALIFLVFDKAIRIEPVECKGKLGLWDAPQVAVKRINQEARRCYRIF